MKLLWRYPELFLLTAIAVLTRCWSLFTPAAVVFDEVYFKVYAGDYLTGSYYFDPHPPLGKLLLAAWAWITHQDPATLTGGDPAVVLRVLPAIAGALIIPVFYLFLRQLGASRRVSTLGAAVLLHRPPREQPGWAELDLHAEWLGTEPDRQLEPPRPLSRCMLAFWRLWS